MRVAAVVLIVLLEVAAALYLYMNPVQGESQNPFFISTSTTTTSKTTSITTTKTTTHPPVDKAAVESAAIINETLSMAVHNLGPSTTKFVSVKAVCSPGFQTCYDYKKLTGAYYRTTFILPAGRTFIANLSGVCIIPIPGCKNLLPVTNNTYYFQVMFSFLDGATALVPVSAMANTTWSPHWLTHRGPTAILNITSPSLEIVPENLTGLLNVTLTLNDSLPYASWTTSLYGFLKPSNAFSGILLTNETGCVGSGSGDYNYTSDGHPLNVSFTADCSQPLSVVASFYTVLTGIAPQRYYALVVRDTTDIDSPPGFPNSDPGIYATFALWVQGYTNSTTRT